MQSSIQTTDDLALAVSSTGELTFDVPNPEDEAISEIEFQSRIDRVWLACDRVDLQSEIWRGRVLRAVRDREKHQSNGRGTGFIHWLQDRELSKSRAYSLIELAESADALLETGQLEPSQVNHFSKRAFVETAHASPEVQQLVSDAAREGERITRRQVRQLADEWTAMTSDLLPDPIKAKAADNSFSPRYLAPFVRELEKLPPAHQTTLQAEVVETPDLDTLKQATRAAQQLTKYLEAAQRVQAFQGVNLDLETALEEALRLDCLSLAADVVNQATQLEQAAARLHTHWQRLSNLTEKLYVNSGSSTPHLRLLLECLDRLAGETISVQIGEPGTELARTIRFQVLPE